MVKAAIITIKSINIKDGNVQSVVLGLAYSYTLGNIGL